MVQSGPPWWWLEHHVFSIINWPIIHFEPKSNDGCQFQSQRNTTNLYIFSGGSKSSKVFVMGILLLKPYTAWCRRIPQSYPPVHRKTVSGRNQDARSKRSSRAFEACAGFFSSEVNHHWKEAPTASFTCERKKRQTQSLMLLARKTIYTIWCYWISWVSLNFRNHV